MDAEDGVQVIAAVDAEGTAMSPDTAMAQPGSFTPTLLGGFALLGLAVLLTVRVLAPRTER